jgi:hypothetical protein
MAEASSTSPQNPTVPWYRRCLRWGQIHFKERDPRYYDLQWWREYWKRNALQGVIVGAGGPAAFYPSKFPWQRRADFLNGRDLTGEWVKAAHEDGLAVLARMCSGQISEEAFRAHPEWVTRLASGEPFRRGDGYSACINGAYFEEYVPGILREIIERTHPEGIAEVEWGLNTRDVICHCANCIRKFRDKSGAALPTQIDWTDPTYRKWIQWNYERHTELWDFNNKVTRAAGGDHCLWIGSTVPGMKSQSTVFHDLREIGKRSEFHTILTDFEEGDDEGKRIHQLVGWDKIAVGWTMMPLYGGYAGRPDAQKSLDTIEGTASGLGPLVFWQDAYQFDRRMYRATEDSLKWHERNQRYLTNRRPVAAVGIAWSQKNCDYYGRANPDELVEAPYRGFTQALMRARIPYLPVHTSDIHEQARDMAVLILPNVGALSDAECDAIREFVRQGGALVATGATSLYDEWGDARADFALADLFGAHAPSDDFGRRPTKESFSFLYLLPELRGKAWGPKGPDDPASGDRHPVLHGFDETDAIWYGGEVPKLRTDAGVLVPLSFKSDPIMYTDNGSNEERMMLRETPSNVAGLVLNDSNNVRVAYLPAAIDRCYADDPTLDHALLLANIVRWASRDRIGFELEGPGVISCYVYRQPGHMIVHLVNITNPSGSRVPLDKLVPVGPFTLRMKLADDVPGYRVESLVSKMKPTFAVNQRRVSVEIGSILDHEVLVIT